MKIETKCACGKKRLKKEASWDDEEPFGDFYKCSKCGKIVRVINKKQVNKNEQERRNIPKPMF